MSKTDVTFVVCLVPLALLACVDVGLISIIRWLLNR